LKSLLARLFRTRSVDDLLADTGREGHRLRRAVSKWHVVALGVGAIIGAGIFATIGTAAGGDARRPGAGPALILSFVLTALVCGFTALCYAELASMVPVAGSAYTYSYATLGEVVAWIIGWDLILEYAIGNVAVAISWANYMDTLLRGVGIRLPAWLVIDYRTAAQKTPEIIAHAPHVLGVPIVFNLLALSIVAALTMVLVRGIRESVRVNMVMVVLKLIVLGFFVLVSAKFVKPDNWHPFAPNGFAGIGAGAAVVFFAYIGFDAVSTCAEEVEDPKRDMPFGIIGSLAISTLVYVVVAAVFTGMMPYAQLARATASERAEPLTMALSYVNLPGWVVGVVALGSVVAHTAVLLVFQLGQPRILFAMSRDGFLPPAFSRVHPRFGTPHVSTLLTGLAVGGAAAVANIDEMVDLTNIGTLAAFVLVCLGVIVLRFREPARERPFRVPFGPLLIPGLGLTSCLFLIVYLPPQSYWRFLGWLGIGLVVYGAYGYRHSRLGQPKTEPTVSI
jgi:APA family basic amino acid/polyamine antiporter